MTRQTLWQSIRSRYYAMSEGERRMADLFLEQKGEILSLSASQIAARAGTGKSSVIRFCQTMGFDGLIAMKEEVRRQLEKDNATNFTPYVSRTSDRKKEAETYFHAMSRVLQETREQVDIDQLSRVADLIRSARRIYVYAAGHVAGGQAGYFADYLTVLGYNAHAITDSFSSRVSAMSIGEGDLAITLSFRGRTVSVVDAAVAARKAGAKTVCITCTPDSKLARISDERIVVETEESLYPTEARSSNYAMSIVLDLLYVFLTSYDKAASTRRLKRFQTLMEAQRYPRRRQGGEPQDNSLQEE